MHVRIRLHGHPDTVVVVESMLSKIEQLRQAINTKFGIQPERQKLFYGGKMVSVFHIK